MYFVWHLKCLLLVTLLTYPTYFICNYVYNVYKINFWDTHVMCLSGSQLKIVWAGSNQFVECWYTIIGIKWSSAHDLNNYDMYIKLFRYDIMHLIIQITCTTLCNTDYSVRDRNKIAGSGYEIDPEADVIVPSL